VVFDRGGYSPHVFTEIIAAGFDLLTYFKGSWARSPISTFTTVDYTGPDGICQSYELAERPIDVPVPAQHASPGEDATVASTLTLRLIIRRSPDGHQTPILTNRLDLTAAEVAYRMAARWRQENYFKYGREHFALDALDGYADTPDDPTRLVPNPAKARALDHVAWARADLTAAHADIAGALDTAVATAGRPGNGGKAVLDPAAGHALAAAQHDLTAAKKASREIPTHLPLGQVRPGSRLLETERKLLTHAIRMSAYNSESALPGYCARTTPAATTKAERCSVKPSPCPETCTSSATPCTSGSTPPQPRDAAKPSPRSAPSSTTPPRSTPGRT